MENNCVVYNTAELIGKRWTILIMLEIYKNKNLIHYQELKRAIPGITSKILSLRLKELQENGIVKKFVDKDVMPISCIYTLTMSGLDFIDIIKRMKAWGLKRDYNKHCNSTDCKNCKF